MSVAQHRVLLALGRRSMTVVGLAQAVDGNARSTQHTLDALYRKSLVTITPAGRWAVTERGRKRLAA